MWNQNSQSSQCPGYFQNNYYYTIQQQPVYIGQEAVYQQVSVVPEPIPIQYSPVQQSLPQTLAYKLGEIYAESLCEDILQFNLQGLGYLCGGNYLAVRDCMFYLADTVQNPYALYYIGLMFYKGDYLAYTPSRANLFLGRAQQAGVLAAYYVQALRFSACQSTSSKKRAEKLLVQAAIGVPQAMLMLAEQYEKDATQQSRVLDLLTSAAQMQNKQAQFKLASYMMNKRSLRAQGYLWLSRAGERGHTHACYYLQQMREQNHTFWINLVIFCDADGNVGVELEYESFLEPFVTKQSQQVVGSSSVAMSAQSKVFVPQKQVQFNPRQLLLSKEGSVASSQLPNNNSSNDHDEKFGAVSSQLPDSVKQTQLNPRQLLLSKEGSVASSQLPNSVNNAQIFGGLVLEQGGKQNLGLGTFFRQSQVLSENPKKFQSKRIQEKSCTENYVGNSCIESSQSLEKNFVQDKLISVGLSSKCEKKSSKDQFQFEFGGISSVQCASSEVKKQGDQHKSGTFFNQKKDVLNYSGQQTNQDLFNIDNFKNTQAQKKYSLKVESSKISQTTSTLQQNQFNLQTSLENQGPELFESSQELQNSELYQELVDLCLKEPNAQNSGKGSQSIVCNEAGNSGNVHNVTEEYPGGINLDDLFPVPVESDSSHSSDKNLNQQISGGGIAEVKSEEIQSDRIVQFAHEKRWNEGTVEVKSEEIYSDRIVQFALEKRWILKDSRSSFQNQPHKSSDQNKMLDFLKEQSQLLEQCNKNLERVITHQRNQTERDSFLDEQRKLLGKFREDQERLEVDCFGSSGNFQQASKNLNLQNEAIKGQFFDKQRQLSEDKDKVCSQLAFGRPARKIRENNRSVRAINSILTSRVEEDQKTQQKYRASLPTPSSYKQILTKPKSLKFSENFATDGSSSRSQQSKQVLKLAQSHKLQSGLTLQNNTNKNSGEGNFVDVRKMEQNLAVKNVGNAGNCKSWQKGEQEAVQEGLQCPITLEVFTDPVVAEDGQTYERHALTAWYCKHGTSPMTQEKMGPKLKPDGEKRKLADKWRRKWRFEN